MEYKDDGKPKQMTWRVFRPAPKPKPEPTVAAQKIILVPKTRIPSPTRISYPTQNPPIIQQKPVSSLGSPLQPKRGPITGSPNQMERGQISGGLECGPRRTANLGPWQATISKTCITCLIIAIIVLAILFLLTLAFSITALVVFLYNGDAAGNWNILTSFPGDYYEVVEDTADTEY